MGNETISTICYESENRIEKLLRLMTFSDRGSFILEKDKINFKGNKYEFNIDVDKIKSIDTYTPEILTWSIPHIKIDFYDKDDNECIKYFVKFKFLPWSARKQTLKLYNKLIERYGLNTRSNDVIS